VDAITTSAMNSHGSEEETTKAKPAGTMPFILDHTLHATQSPPPIPTAGDGDILSAANPHVSIASPVSSPPRAHRAQTTTAVLHHSLRPVPEEISVPAIAEHAPSAPRRPRAITTAVSKPRNSTERIPEEDASWWTEEIHKRREIRRRMREVEDENTVIIGNKIDSNHPNYVTAYNMLTGLRVAVRPDRCWKKLMARCRASVQRWIAS